MHLFTPLHTRNGVASSIATPHSLPAYRSCSSALGQAREGWTRQACGADSRKPQCNANTNVFQGATPHGSEPHTVADVPLMDLEDLPVLPGLPIVGVAVGSGFALDGSSDIGGFFEEFGDHFVVNLGFAGGHSLITQDPDEITDILTRADVFKMRWPNHMEKLSWPDRYVQSNDEVWAWRRAMGKLLHSHAVMHMHLPLMVANTQRIIHKAAHSGEVVKWRKEAQRICFSNSIQAILGDVLTEEEVEWVLPRTQARDEGYTKLDFGLANGLPFTRYWQAARARDELREFFCTKIESIMHEQRADLEAGNRNTLLGHYFEVLEKEGLVTETTSNREIGHKLAGWVDFTQLAGADAPGYSVARVVKWLAVHPEWIDTLWEEQQRLMHEHGDAITQQVVSRSAVAMAVVQESLRLTPAFWAIQKTATADTTVGGLCVPANTNIVLAIGEATKNTGNKSRFFDPAQWLSEDHTQVTINKEKGNTIFSTGPRGCPGQTLTIVELAVAVSVLAREVKGIEISEEEVEMPLNNALKWPSDMLVKLVPRGNNAV